MSSAEPNTSVYMIRSQGSGTSAEPLLFQGAGIPKAYDKTSKAPSRSPIIPACLPARGERADGVWHSEVRRERPRWS
jgi:hypothetical protein